MIGTGEFSQYLTLSPTQTTGNAQKNIKPKEIYFINLHITINCKAK